MSRPFYLVHCIHAFRQPKLYKVLHMAQKKLLREPGLQLLECSDENMANQQFQEKLDDYNRALNANKLAILKQNLEPSHPTQAEIDSAFESVKMLEEDERLKREEEVSAIFKDKHLHEMIHFKAHPFSVSR